MNRAKGVQRHDTLHHHHHHHHLVTIMSQNMVVT